MEYADQRPCAWLAGWHSWEKALQIMAMGKVKLAPIITSRVRLEDWREAFERLERKADIKTMLYPNENYLPG